MEGRKSLLSIYGAAIFFTIIQCLSRYILQLSLKMTYLRLKHETAQLNTQILMFNKSCVQTVSDFNCLRAFLLRNLHLESNKNPMRYSFSFRVIMILTV